MDPAPLQSHPHAVAVHAMHHELFSPDEVDVYTDHLETPPCSVQQAKHS